MKYNELSHSANWMETEGFLVSSELFLDVIFTEKCNRKCPFCIANTKYQAIENREKWEASLRTAFERFRIKSVIVLGGEATIDSCFWEKLELVSDIARKHSVDRIILTTNGTQLVKKEFLEKLCESDIDAVNLSRMHDMQEQNDDIFGGSTPTHDEILHIYHRLKEAGKTLRLNVNIWRGNLDSAEEMDRFANKFSGCCDAIKYSPLMDTEMFDTISAVEDYTRKYAISDMEIRPLYDQWCEKHNVISRCTNVLGYVDYAEVMIGEQKVILKYAQVEDKYDRETVIPTLKLYPNGYLSNEWNCRKNILE